MRKKLSLGLAIVALGAGVGHAQTEAAVPGDAAEASTLVFEARPGDPNQPFNPFFETAGQGDLRIYLPLPPVGTSERGLEGANAFDFGGVRNDRRSSTSRRGILFR